MAGVKQVPAQNAMRLTAMNALRVASVAPLTEFPADELDMQRNSAGFPTNDQHGSIHSG